jgi:holo-[acyl-carrier protein] synthase
MALNSKAARFAAKEALAKALGAPAGMQWQDAEVHRGPDGRPHFEVRGTVDARVQALGITSIHVSLSHDAGIASARRREPGVVDGCRVRRRGGAHGHAARR